MTLAPGAALAFALLLQPTRAAAQRLPERRFAPAPVVGPAPSSGGRVEAPPDSARRPEVHPLVIATGALVGGALGGLVGGYLGYQASNDPQCDGICGPLGAALLGLILEPIGMGLGAHLANGGRGSGALDALGAAGTLYLMVLAGRNAGSLYVAIPLQVVATVAIERATARRKRP